MLFWKLSKLGLAGLMIALLVTAAAACGGDDDTSDDDANGGEPTAAASATPSSSTDPVTEITISMIDNLFVPDSFSVPLGQEVTVTIRNDGAAVHNMHVLSAELEGREFTSAQVVNPAREDTFTMSFSKAGVVAFQCDYHLPEMGGSITIVN